MASLSLRLMKGVGADACRHVDCQLKQIKRNYRVICKRQKQEASELHEVTNPEGTASASISSGQFDRDVASSHQAPSRSCTSLPFFSPKASYSSQYRSSPIETIHMEASSASLPSSNQLSPFSFRQCSSSELFLVLLSLAPSLTSRCLA